jgi:hypothetical protein
VKEAVVVVRGQVMERTRVARLITFEDFDEQKVRCTVATREKLCFIGWNAKNGVMWLSGICERYIETGEVHVFFICVAVDSEKLSVNCLQCTSQILEA